MQVAVLASGSKGNATFVEMDGIRILIDAGISARRIKQELAALGESVEMLDGIFITHEHGDHIKGLPNLVKKYGIQIYSRPATFRAMSCYEELPGDCVNPIIDRIQLGRVAVRAFDIPHDAAAPVGYIIQGTSRCVVATDIGNVDDRLQQMLEGAQVLVLEANHDEEMLKQGSYPYNLKQRILGPLGHLSNRRMAQVVAELRRRPQKLILAHLSESNNRPELATDTVKSVLDSYGINNMEIYMTAQNHSTSVDF